jgi:hypothetical protein
MRLRVHAGSASQASWGWTSVSFGVTSVVVGTVFFIVGHVTEPDATDSKYRGSGAGNLQHDQSVSDNWKGASYWTFGIGAALIGLGIALVATATTDVVDDSGVTLGAPRLKLPGGMAATPGGIQF